MKEKEDFKDYKMSALSPEELEDMLASLRIKILDRVRILGKEFKILMALQERREKIEIRLEELGYGGEE